MPNILKTVKLKTKMETYTTDIEMSIYNDGAVSFSEGADFFIYLYPDVVKKVRRQLNAITKEQC